MTGMLIREDLHIEIHTRSNNSTRADQHANEQTETDFRRGLFAALSLSLRRPDTDDASWRLVRRQNAKRNASHSPIDERISSGGCASSAERGGSAAGSRTPSKILEQAGRSRLPTASKALGMPTLGMIRVR